MIKYFHFIIKTSFTIFQKSTENSSVTTKPPTGMQFSYFRKNFQSQLYCKNVNNYLSFIL